MRKRGSTPPPIPPSPPKLPDCIVGCFRSSAIIVDELCRGDVFYIVWAYGKSSVLRRLVFQGLRSVEYISEHNMHHFTVKIIATDDFGVELLISLDDVNLSGNSSTRFTNHQCFKYFEDADYYVALCKDFNIQADFNRFE